MAEPAAATAAAFSGADFRATLGAFATGVTVITTRGDAHDYGMTATAFSSSLSLDPPHRGEVFPDAQLLVQVTQAYERRRDQLAERERAGSAERVLRWPSSRLRSPRNARGEA